MDIYMCVCVYVCTCMYAQCKHKGILAGPASAISFDGQVAHIYVQMCIGVFFFLDVWVNLNPTPTRSPVFCSVSAHSTKGFGGRVHPNPPLNL